MESDFGALWFLCHGRRCREREESAHDAETRKEQNPKTHLDSILRRHVGGLLLFCQFPVVSPSGLAKLDIDGSLTLDTP